MFPKMITLFICWAILIFDGSCLPIQVLAQKHQHLKIKLLETGSFHGKEVTGKTGEEWLGLYITKEGSRLLPSLLTVKRVKDAGVDVDSGQKTGKKVSVNHPQKPVFLLKGADFLQAGSVTTTFIGQKELNNKSNIALKLNEKTYHLKVKTKDKSDSSGIGRDDAKLVLVDSNQSQVLYDLGGKGEGTEAWWYLLWAGDVDGDGKLDVYVNVSYHYNVSLRKLFLSSQASPNQLVREVAELRSVGC